MQGAHYLSDCLFSLPQGLLILTATGTPPRWLAALPSQPQRADDAMPARQASLLAASCCWLLSLHPAVRLTGSTQGVAAAAGSHSALCAAVRWSPPSLPAQG